MKKTFLSLAAATLLGLTFSACQIDITPTEDNNKTKVDTNVAINKYDGYSQEQLQNLGDVQAVAPITDLIGHTFYTLDLSDAMYGDAYYSVLTFNHLDSPDGIVSEDYMLANGEWVKDTYSDDEDGSNEIYDIQGDKLHITGQDCYYDGYSSEQVCEDYENDIYIIDKQADEWLLQISYNSDGFSDTMIESFYFNEPVEVQNPSLINLGNESYDDYNNNQDNYNGNYQDYNNNGYYDENGNYQDYNNNGYYDENGNYQDYNNNGYYDINSSYPDYNYSEYDYNNGYSIYSIEGLKAEKNGIEQALNNPYLDQVSKDLYQRELDKIQAEIDSRNSSAANSRVQRTLHRVHRLFR